MTAALAWVVRLEWVAYGQLRHRTTNPLTREQAEAYVVALENDPKARGKKVTIERHLSTTSTD